MCICNSSWVWIYKNSQLLHNQDTNLIRKSDLMILIFTYDFDKHSFFTSLIQTELIYLILCMTGCLIYFVLTLFAACKGWQCWFNSCGFSLMGMLSGSVTGYVSIFRTCPKYLNNKYFALQHYLKFCFLPRFFYFYHSGKFSIYFHLR